MEVNRVLQAMVGGASIRRAAHKFFAMRAFDHVGQIAAKRRDSARLQASFAPAARINTRVPATTSRVNRAAMSVEVSRLRRR
jgi:hypothetical protein